MSALTELRQHVADLLSGALGVKAHPAMPDRIVPPAAIVLPGAPYLSASGTFGSFAVRLDVVVVADAKVSGTGAAVLDGLIDDAVVALVNDGASVSEVSEPWQLSTGTATYLASTITTTYPVTL